MKLKDIETLHADGYLSDEQKAKIIAHYRLEDKSSRWLLVCLSLLAAALIAGGAGMLVMAHWLELTMLGKALSGGILLAAVWLAYIVLQPRTPVVAEGLALVGAALWGANIALHSALFQPHANFEEGCFLFFCGIVLLPFITPQRVMVGVVAITSVILLVNIAYVPVNIDNTPKSWLHIEWLRDEYFGNFIAAVSLLGLFWWLLGERCRNTTGMYRGYYWVGVVSFLGLLIFTLVNLLGAIHGEEAVLTTPGYIMAGAALLLAILLKPKGVAWLWWLLMAAGTCALIALSIYQQQDMDWGMEPREVSHPVFIGTAASALYAALLMLVGTRSKRVAWINYGAITAIITLIAVLSNIFKSLETSGITLILTGSMVLVFILLLENQRRSLIKKAKQQPTTPSQA